MEQERGGGVFQLVCAQLFQLVWLQADTHTQTLNMYMFRYQLECTGCDTTTACLSYGMARHAIKTQFSVRSSNSFGWGFWNRLSRDHVGKPCRVSRLFVRSGSYIDWATSTTRGYQFWNAIKKTGPVWIIRWVKVFPFDYDLGISLPLEQDGLKGHFKTRKAHVYRAVNQLLERIWHHLRC